MTTPVPNTLLLLRPKRTLKLAAFLVGVSLAVATVLALVRRVW